MPMDMCDKEQGTGSFLDIFFSFVQEDRSHSLKRERHTVKSDQLLRVPLQVPFWERPSEDKAFLNPTFPGVRLSWSACFCLPSLTEKC